MTEQDKVTVDDIIGIVKTDGQTNSVQLKKEAQLSICEKRLIELEKENEQLRKEKIDAEVKLYSANEKILMQMDYDEIIKQNTENEIEITNLKKENEQLKNRVDELEDDNMKYTLSTDKLEEYTKRFIPTKCINEFRDCKTNRYYRLDNEDNFTGALELLNLLDCENEQLKTTIQQLRTDNTKQKKKLNTAMKENEQLKSQLRIYRRIASCSNCDYHDYDEFENSDGSYDEFEVCRKGNDVTERICKDWREL